MKHRSLQNSQSAHCSILLWSQGQSEYKIHLLSQEFNNDREGGGHWTVEVIFNIVCNGMTPKCEVDSSACDIHLAWQILGDYIYNFQQHSNEVKCTPRIFGDRKSVFNFAFFITF